jgi:hypothetical protein
MADLKAGLTATLLFIVLLLAAKQPVLLSAALAGGAYLGVRLLLAPKTIPREKPWLEPLAQRWSGRDEGERLASVLRIMERLRQTPELMPMADEHLVYIKRGCEPYKTGINPTGQARTELLTLLELVERRLLRLAEAHRHDDDRALASELAALRQTLVELVPERVIGIRKQ